MADNKSKQNQIKKSFMTDMSDAFTNVFEAQRIDLRPFLPKDDLVGGSVPYVAGAEDEAIWNAASQACGTERIHYTYTVDGNKCWYLATPSQALANNPDSWCPLAAALPGNSEYWDKDTVYIYEEEGTASALRWDADTGRLQVYLGPSRILLPRIQSMDTNFVTINPQMAKKVAWKSRSLNREKMSRLLMKTMFFTAVLMTIASFTLWAFLYIANLMAEPDLKEARKVTEDATNKLMIEAVNAYQNTTDMHLSRVIELLNTIGSFGGVLTKYEVTKDGKVEWLALIPSAVKPDQINATAIGSEGDRVKIRGTR